MVTSEHRERVHAFVLRELAACILVTACIVALLAVVAPRSRSLSKLSHDMHSLRTIHASTLSYGADFQDRFWQFSWQANQVYWSPTDPAAAGLTPTVTATQAALQQMTYLIRTLGQRPASEIPNFANTNVWPYRTYGHLALLHYLGSPAPSRLFTSTGDLRWQWAADPRGYDQGLYTPNLGTGGGVNSRHPYGASFLVGTCFYDNAPVGTRVAPGATTNFLIVFPSAPPGTMLGKRLSDVTYPHNKTFTHDTIARHFAPAQVYHMLPGARLPALLVDGNAAVRPFSHANPGANPNGPAEPAPLIAYSPTATEPPGTPTTHVFPGPLWTRMGLQGRDFNGAEVYPSP